METFARKYAPQIRGVISCFDRVVLSGTLPAIRYGEGMAAYMTTQGMKLFEYTSFVNRLRQELRDHAEKNAHEAGCPLEFIRRLDGFRKEDRVKEVVRQRGTHPGLVHIFSAMERCTAFQPCRPHRQISRTQSCEPKLQNRDRNRPWQENRRHSNQALDGQVVSKNV